MKKNVYERLFEHYPELAPQEDSLRAAQALLERCFAAGGKLLCCGNGGSAADCEHIVGELMKSFTLSRPLPRRWEERFAAAGVPDPAALRKGLQQGLPALALSAHTALATAWSNDADPTLIYAQQVFALGRPGDILLGISTSGNAQNVLQAAYTARAMDLSVLALTGEAGGALAPLADVCLRAPAKETYRVQEYHLPLYHALCEATERSIFGCEQIPREELL